MSGCTCETYGHCNACRPYSSRYYCNIGEHVFLPVDSEGWLICEWCGIRRHVDSTAWARYRQGIISRRQLMESIQMTTYPMTAHATDTCVWCRQRFAVDDMFRVGKDTDNRRVCGPDCPCRPKQHENKKPVPGYTVTTTVQVSGRRIQSATHAINIVKKAARVGYTDKRVSDFEIRATENK